MKIKLSNSADKFLKKNKIKDEELIFLLQKFIKFLKGEIINLDVKKMKGKWKGAYRIRVGKIRIIIFPNLDQNEFFIDRIDFRGNIYKE